MPKRKRNSYDAAFKLKVVTFAENSNNCAAARHFELSEKLVGDWRKNKDKLTNCAKTLKKVRFTPSPYSAMETDLNEWILELRQNGYIVTRTSIRIKALTLAKSGKYSNMDEFKASAGWCSRFMNRHNLCIRQRTHIAQKLPQDVDEKVSSFQKFIIEERQKYNYQLSDIGNMDETPMFFDMPGNSTVHIKGEKTVSVKTCGAEKSHFTVVLACLADGTKLKPMVIFKRKTLPKEKVPGVIIAAQQKGWMDEERLHMWLQQVWECRPGGLLKRKSLLVWDMFRTHLVTSVKRKLGELNTHQAVKQNQTNKLCLCL